MKFLLFGIFLGSSFVTIAHAEDKGKKTPPPSWIANGEESWERGEKLRGEKRLTEASDAYLNGCKKSHGESCFSYARDSERRGLFRRAARFYSYACDMKVTRGCAKSGALWAKRGQTELAAQAFQKGCEAGDVKACATLKNQKTMMAH